MASAVIGIMCMLTYFCYSLLCKTQRNEYSTQIIIYIARVNQLQKDSYKDRSFLNLLISSRLTSDSGKEFHRLIVEGKKEFK